MQGWPFTGLLCIASFFIGACGRGDPPPEERYRQNLSLLRAGEFERAAAEAQAAETTVSKKSELLCLFRLLRIEALLDGDNLREAEKLLAAPPSSPSPEYDVRSRIFRARLHVAKSELHTASALVTEAQQGAEQLDRPDLLAEADMQMGTLLARLRDYERAEVVLRHAVTSVDKTGDVFRMASARNNLGMLRMLRSHCDEALGLFEKAEEQWRTVGAKYWSGIARGNAGSCYGQLGDLGKALTYRQESMVVRRPGARKANALGEMGTLLLADEPAKAATYYRQARDMALQFGSQPDAARWAGNLTFALTSVADWPGAERALADAIQLRPEPRSRAFLDLSAAEISFGKGQVEESRALYKQLIDSSQENPSILWAAHSGLADTWAKSGNAQEASKHFAAAISVIENKWSDLNANEYKITFLSSLIRFYQNYVDALMAQGQTEQALTIVERSRARLLAQRLSRNVPHTPSSFEVVARKSGSVWLCYWLAPRRSFLWAITQDKVQSFTLPPAGEIERLVRDYRGFIESAMRDPIVSPSESGKELYNKLIAPAVPLLAKDGSVVIVPDGALHQLSFDTVPIYGDSPRYLLNDYSLAIAPSIGIYRGSQKPSANREALIIGDPLPAGPNFPSLPHVRAEIANVQKRLAPAPSHVVTGAAARSDTWAKSNPGKYSLIHIAAHAEANETNPLLSAIILSPGPNPRLFARDMIDTPLRADLVTLSACRSSGAKAYKGEGLVGFAWTFLQAGSHSVIAGLWDVADESTSVLMDRLYEGIARKEPPARALRAARLALQKTQWSKPYYWGPFQCYIR